MRHLTWIPVIIAMLAFVARANGADTNMANRCTPDGVTCVSDCKNFTPQAEDDPCWFVVSCDSDWTAPWLSLGVRDYRGDCP